jgi:shikimate kinase
MNVVLLGMKHSGKSTLGAALAKRWSCELYDVDPMIQSTHASERNEELSVREIFSQYGEEHFRRLEVHAVCELYLKLDKPGSNAVVALGGRTALNKTICELLRAIGLTVYLHVPPEVIYERIQRAGLPPFLQGEDPHEQFLELYRHREPQYRAVADTVVDLGQTHGVDESVDTLIRTIEEHQHGR